MKQPFPPSLLALDNATEGEAEVIRAEIDLFLAMSRKSGLPVPVCREIFLDELGKFPPAAIIPQPKKHWLDAVPWFWRLAVVIVFALAVYVYGRMLGAW